MTAHLVDQPDSIRVLTDRLEWTILKTFTDGRGPCYVSDVRERKKPYRRLVRDGGLAHTINDPSLGGLFSVGVVAARPPVDPAHFWDSGWEITTRLDAGGGGFGVRDPRVSIVPDEESLIAASCSLHVLGARALDVGWWYRFGPGDQVRCGITLRPAARPDLRIKEPKIVTNGLLGWRTLTVRNRAGKILITSRRDGPVVDLSRYRDPRAHTKQIANPGRFLYTFQGEPGRLDVTCGDGLQRWTEAADAAEPMNSSVDVTVNPKYCLRSGRLWSRTELPRWERSDLCGLSHHGWEGGTGADDCLACFRPWPTEPAAVTLTVTYTPPPVERPGTR